MSAPKYRIVWYRYANVIQWSHNANENPDSLIDHARWIEGGFPEEMREFRQLLESSIWIVRNMPLDAGEIICSLTGRKTLSRDEYKLSTYRACYVW